MKWLIPAKTFLIGEYAALADASAILLTTTPYFELSLTSQIGLSDIHPNSPAGIWWQQQNHLNKGLSWYDPYHNLGGLGASSAQFLGSYLAHCALKNTTPNLEIMLKTYYQSSWTGKGLKPSGYDVIAQSQSGCIYINRQRKVIQSYAWPFQDLSFFLIHTGVKLATHHHLQNTNLPQNIDELSTLADKAQQAFIQADSKLLINCVNLYHKQLTKLNLIAPHSIELINQLKEYPELLAIKGCGAMGADILLLLTARNEAKKVQHQLKEKQKLILATENTLNFNPNLLRIE